MLISRSTGVEKLEEKPFWDVGGESRRLEAVVSIQRKGRAAVDVEAEKISTLLRKVRALNEILSKDLLWGEICVHP